MVNLNYKPVDRGTLILDKDQKPLMLIYRIGEEYGIESYCEVFDKKTYPTFTLALLACLEILGIVEISKGIAT